MNLRVPASHARSKLRFSPFDVIWGGMSPLLTLYLRNAPVLSEDSFIPTGIYCVVSLAFSLAAFAAFRIHTAIPRYFSLYDGIDLAKAVVTSELMTSVTLFTFTRLDGIPRSTPVIHALLLWVGLIGARALIHRATKRQEIAISPAVGARRENLILIGLNDLAVSFTSFIHTASRGEKRVIAFLDTESRRVGRVVNGVAVLGRPAHLDAIIEEFATHGVCTDQVAVSGAPNLLSKEDMVEVHRVCAQRNLDLLFLDRIFGQALAPTIDNSGEAKLTCSNVNGRGLVLSFYFRVKRAVDFFASVASLALLSPLWLLAASLTWLFVGSPILFWQQRMGLDGRSFDLYKMRTLRPPFDREGQKLCEAERLSCVGWLLRVTRIDELPQLLNVINGDMSLIGPRPLLPQDQPANPAARLTVRPGITGWAQVNGGGLLSPGEKETLDLWYIQNASFWFDLRIISMTFLSVIRGDRRNERALARARAATVMDRSGVRKEEEDLLVLGVDLNPTARHGIPATATAAAQSD